MCPENPMGYVGLSEVYHFDYWLDTKAPLETLEKAIELAQKAIAMDDSIPASHSQLCWLYANKGEYDKAIAEGQRAVALNPGETFALAGYGDSLTAAGRPEEAIPILQKAIRLTPFGDHYLYRELGLALQSAGRFEESVSAYKKALQLQPDGLLARLQLVVAYAMMGREQEAHAEVAEVLRINPKFSLDDYAKKVAYRLKDKSKVDKLVDDLRKAGLK